MDLVKVHPGSIESRECDADRLDPGVIEGRSVLLHFSPDHVIRLIRLILGLETILDRSTVGREEAHTVDHFEVTFNTDRISGNYRNEESRVGNGSLPRPYPLAIPHRAELVALSRDGVGTASTLGCRNIAAGNANRITGRKSHRIIVRIDAEALVRAAVTSVCRITAESRLNRLTAFGVVDPTDDTSLVGTAIGGWSLIHRAIDDHVALVVIDIRNVAAESRWQNPTFDVSDQRFVDEHITGDGEPIGLTVTDRLQATSLEALASDAIIGVGKPGFTVGTTICRSHIHQIPKGHPVGWSVDE